MKLFKMAPLRGQIVNIKYSKPFVLNGDPRKAVLFLPGLTRFPRDGEFIGQILHKGDQATFFAEILPGHESFISFARTRAWHMLDQCEKKLIERYSEVGHPVVLIGVSTGALIYGIIAARHPDKVRAVVLISAARTLLGKVQSLLMFGLCFQWLLWPLNRWTDYWCIPANAISTDPDEEDVEGRPRHTHIPIWCGSSILYLQWLFWRSLPKIKSPVLVVFSKGDRVVPPKVAESIFEALNRGRAESEHELVALAHAPHVPTIPEMLKTAERQILELRLQKFLRRVWAKPFVPMSLEERMARKMWKRVKRLFGRAGRPQPIPPPIPQPFVSAEGPVAPPTNQASPPSP